MHDQPPMPAIPAHKNALGDELLYLLFGRRSFQNYFDRVWMQHVGPLPTKGHGPYIFYLTHSGWWDGYIMMLIHRIALQRAFDSYLMQEERQLRAYRFFTWCGVFSVNRHDPESSWRSQQYAANLLHGRPDRALYIFPQGKIVHPDLRPITIYPGIARIAALVGDVTLCPIALRYEFLGQQWPHAFMRIGPTHRPQDAQDVERTQAEITHAMTAAADGLREDVLAQRLDRFRPLLRGRVGIDQRFAHFLRMVKRL
ncbi:lysophospholipid acyltransferase family protein [Candidatus Oscillochloris fontis]|uniref:lysophospholipid acyltransferase family protein n=1 Tax=Candidatus Oscillochloris fontis TaxID=2496868 RepID=UPI00101BC34B|nr:lysophospholipid acyltransferase family protein [Candidatus Oscillochloris fontis]